MVHRVPLFAAGSDSPSDMQLMTKFAHKTKTRNAYEMIHSKLIKSYAMDVLLQKKNGDKVSVAKAKSFIQKAAQCEEKRYESIGYGWDHRFEGKTIVGSSLVYQEKVIHKAFFKIDEEERVGTISSSSRRRRFRI